jgi:iron complex transport system substrate-binding protein
LPPAALLLPSPGRRPGRLSIPDRLDLSVGRDLRYVAANILLEATVAMVLEKIAGGRLSPLIVLVALCALPAAASARTVVDATGCQVEIADDVERVFPAGPPAAVLLYTLAPEKMLGWVHAPSPEAKAFLDPRGAALPQLGNLMRDGKVDAGAMEAAKPDLFIDFGTVSPRYVERARQLQAETGIPSLLLDGALEKTPEIYRLLGPVLGAAERGEALAAEADRILAAGRAALGKRGSAAPLRVYYGRGEDGLTTGASSSVNAELLKLLGLVNVAGDVGSPGLTKVTREQILSWSPDAVLTVSAQFAAALRADQGWSGLAAVRGGKILLSPVLPFGWIDEPPSVNRLLGVLWAGHMLYPDTVVDDPRQAARAFYRLFYRVDLTDAQLAELLR